MIEGPNWKIIESNYESREGYRNELTQCKYTEEKKCNLCNQIFDYGRLSQNLNCNCCKLLVECNYCKKEFEHNQRNILDKIANNKPIVAYCNLKCANGFRNTQDYMIEASRKNGIKRGSQIKELLGKQGVCSVCKQKKIIVDVSLRCEECCIKGNSETINNIKKEGKCSICNLFNLSRDQNGRGKECGCSKAWYLKHNSSEKMIEVSIKNLGDLCNFNFIEKDNVLFYKGIEINELIRKLDNYEIEIPPGFEKRFGRWCYNRADILTDNKLLKSGKIFEEKNNVLHYLDKKTGEYTPWESYKIKFMDNSKNLDVIGEFQTVPTFRSKDSIDWSGARGAFEQNLLDLNVGWFVYLKLDENNNPLVIGKSGSLKVNSSGSDLSFSTDIEDGPSRRYLHENNLDWNKEFIGLIKCDNEEQALELESELLDKYNLFGS